MRIALLYILLCINNLTAQFSDDFSDGDFTTNPSWSGDVGDFIVNEDFQLQLNALEAGSSFLWTTVAYPDSFAMSLELQMEFSPSGSNFSRIYFGINNADVENTNGYYIQAGENGSDDALELHLLSNGTDSIINRTANGSIASSLVNLGIKIIGKSNDSLTLLTSIDNNGSFKEEFSWLNDRVGFSEQTLIGFYCTYTASRVDKFFFDNILIDLYTPDLIPPHLLNVIATNNSTLELIWNEKLDIESVNPINIFVDNSIGEALTAIVHPNASNKIIAIFDNEFNGKTDYNLTVNMVRDAFGNESTSEDFLFTFAETPQPNDLKLSEILYDPYPDGSDFVEIYNNTDRRLNLSGIIIGNDSKNEEGVLPFYILEPSSYLAISEDIENIKTTYQIGSDAHLLEADLPSFNNGSGNVYIKHEEGDWNESFDYNDDIHNQLIDDIEGVSLERLSFEITAMDNTNWFSSAGENLFATPGYENSNRINPILNTGFELESTKFSPNSDGENDQMRLLYSLDNPGKILNLSIYDSNGFFVKKIADNLTLGTKGIVSWDGTGNNGQLSRLGIYIVKGSCFDLNGNTVEIKKVISLVDFIK